MFQYNYLFVVLHLGAPLYIVGDNVQIYSHFPSVLMLFIFIFEVPFDAAAADDDEDFNSP